MISGTEFLVRVNFSEQVSPLLVSNVQISGGATLVSVTRDSPTAFTAFLTVPSTFDSPVGIAVLENVVTDNFLNGNLGGHLAVRVDNIRPTLTVTSDLEPSPVFGLTVTTATGRFNVTFTFSEPVTSFNSSGVSLIGATKFRFFALSPLVYKLEVEALPNIFQNLIVSVDAGRAVDVAQNPSLDSFLSLRVNTQPPRFVVGANNTCSFSFPSTCPPLLNVNRLSTAMIIAFSEPVSNFGESDIVITGALAESIQFEVLSLDQVFQISIVPRPEASEVVISIPASDCCVNNCLPTVNLCPRDADGNVIPPLVQRIPVDLLPPVPLLSLSNTTCALSANVLNTARPASPIQITVPLDSSFPRVPVVVINPPAAAAVSGTTVRGNIVEAVLTAARDTQASVSVSLAAGAAIDLLLNPSQPVALTATVDTVAPSLELSLNFDPDFGTITRFHNLQTSLLLTVNASETLASFSNASVSVVGATTEAVGPTGLPDVFAMPIFLTPTQTDPVGIVVIDGSVSDLACNPNRASNSISLQVGEHLRFLAVSPCFTEVTISCFF